MTEASSRPTGVLGKLDELVAQHAELCARLEDPAVLSDHNAVRELSIKRAA
ncbi:MAG: hypothetical protein IIC49_02800, partial [Planctomycetes bacterium]|nr:hypothetical protein [Planctomycetota bacterium]